MRLRRLLLAVVLAVLLLFNAAAAEADEALTEGISPEAGLPSEVSEEIGSYKAFSTDSFSNALGKLLKDAFMGIGGSVNQGLACCGMILAAVLLCGLAEASEQISGASAIVGALAITAACTGSLSSMITLGTQTIERIDRYVLLLLPGLSSLAAASGGMASSGALYIGTLFFLKLLMSLIRFFLVPGIYMMILLSAAEAALDNAKLKKLRELIRWTVAGVLKLSLYLFTGFLTVSGVIAGTTDAMRLKAAKIALSGTVPVVGGIISDASDTLLTSAATVKNSVGTYGLIAVLAISLFPFFRVAVLHLMMKLTTALSGLIGRSCHVSLVEHLTDAMGLVVAMVGAYSMMILICITVFLKIAV